MAEVKKLRNSQKTASGLTLVLLGAFVMLLGFVLAFATSGTLLYIFLYGFTGAGLIIVFAGLVKVFQ